MYPQQTTPPPNNPSDYDFIVNPAAPARRNVIGSNSMKTRIIIVVGGFFVLLILFVIVKNLLISDSSNYPALLRVATEQQELIHITSAVNSNGQAVSDTNRTLAVTTELSLTSARSQLIAYMATQGKKVTQKQLVYIGAKTVDEQLAASIAASTYDTTFRQVVKTQLTDYQLSIKQAYAKTTGGKGRELLNKQYDGATLLLKQVDASQS